MDPTCPLCGVGSEDTIHVFRDCAHSRSLWRKVVPSDKWRLFCNMTPLDWFWWNIKGQQEASKEWAARFVILCWWIWRRRNLFVFEKRCTLNDSILASTSAIMECFNSTNDRLAGTRLKGVTLASSRDIWRPPDEGWVKVNVDGAYSRAENKCACGGIIRNACGTFLKGFIHPIEHGDELSAEIWACLLGLKTAWAMGFRKVWLETDSTECLELITHEQRINHRDSGILTEVKNLLHMDWVTKVTYVPRFCNSAADYLARRGLESRWGFHEIYQPSEDLQMILCQDCNGCNNPIGAT